MVSKVDICNLALQNIGAKSITTLTDGTVEATECNLRYDTVRRSILELHPWNFAIKRAALNKLSTSPAFGADNQFGLPSDLVRMFATEEQTDFINFGSNFNGYLTISNQTSFSRADEYKLEIAPTGEKVLLSDDAAKNIIYVFDQEDVAKFAPMFVELLAKALGAAIAYKVTNSRTMASAEKQEFTDMLRSSKTVDAQQGTFERTEQSTYLGVRQ